MKRSLIRGLRITVESTAAWVELGALTHYILVFSGSFPDVEMGKEYKSGDSLDSSIMLSDLASIITRLLKVIFIYEDILFYMFSICILILNMNQNWSLKIYSWLNSYFPVGIFKTWSGKLGYTLVTYFVIYSIIKPFSNITCYM